MKRARDVYKREGEREEKKMIEQPAHYCLWYDIVNVACAMNKGA